MICGNCYEELTGCDHCGEAFEEEQDIKCIDDGDAHVCEDCLDDWFSEHHVFKSAKVEGGE